MKLAALIIVAIGFAALVAWVFWPSNRARLEAHGSMPLDDHDAAPDAPEPYCE